MAQAGNFQFGVDESFLSQSVSRALINGTKMAQRSGALTPGINEQAFRQPLGRITGDVNKFQSSLAAANQRVIAFGASASVFYGLSTALKGLVTSTIQVNKSMVDINSIFGLSATNLGKFKNELFDVARKTSQSFGTVAESAKEFSRQGLSVEETLKRVRDSMILTRLTGLSAAEAANTLTAAMNSFNKSGLNTTEILNKMVAADSAFAVSSKDLADALTRVGSTAQDAGVQFEELLALVTSVKQITGREGAVIANGFKTIFNREERSTTIEMLERLGVAVRDQNSNILPTIQILKNLAVQYDKLGVSQKQQVAQMMGGVYQMNTLKAVMSDLSKQNSIYDQALKQIGKSQDEAIKRNEYLNTSFAAMVQRAQDTLSQVGNNLGEKIFSSNTDSLQSTIKNLFGKENFDGFLDGLKGVDTEGVGNTLGQGLIKGIGNVFGISSGVPGPGLIAIGFGITKVISTSLGMAIKDAQSMLGLNQRIQNINVGVERALVSANDAEKMRLVTAKSLAEQEMVILDILLRQNAAMGRMAAEKNALQVSIVSNNPKLATQAIKMAKFTPGAADGYMPAVAKEAHSISRGVGGASPSAKPVLIPNFNFGGGKQGPIVANTDEYLVPNYAGRGSAIFNKEMVANYGVPAGAVRVAANGLSPINIENQYGRLKGNLFGNTSFNIQNISTSKRGLGYSKILYQELVSLLGERGAKSIYGTLIPQEDFLNPNIKAILPQLSRGKFGKNNILELFNQNDESGPIFNFRGGDSFDKDLSLNENRIRQFMQRGYGTAEFTTHLANGHIPNYARRGRPSIKGRQIRYEGDMDFREVLGPEALMELFTIFGFDLGKHPTKSTLDRKSLEKFGISIPEGLTPGSKFPYRGAANGLVPKSLSNAISREIKAGAPLSSIYLDKDSRLVSKDNPQGLLVANRRDEPAGGFEGVNRYQNMGLNPKVAGFHIPNFADPSEMILKYLTKSGQATPILGDIAYPGSKASMGDAQASIEKYLSGIIKNINLKDVDFLSADFQKQIQTKVKGSIEKSFSGIDFGRTSAFSKITDQIIETREKEIKSLQNYQIAARENNVINQKRFAFEDSVRKSLRGGSATMMTPNEIIKQRTNQFTTEDIEYRGSRILTKQPLDLVLTEEEKFAANLKNQKSKLNKILEEQITHLKIREGTSFKSLTSSERKSLIGGLQDRAISTYNLGSSGLSKQEILQNQQARILITEQVKRDFAGIFKKDIPLPEQGAWSKFKGRMSSPIGQMAMMMGPSMLSGFIPEGQGGTGMGRSLGGAQGALQGMGTGAMFGPWGAAIGAIGGGLLGLASKWEKSFAELGKEIDEVNSKNMKVVNNVGLYVQQIDQISELMTEGTDPKKIKELIRKQTQLYGSFEDPEIRKALMSGKPEDAARMATEKAQRQQLKGDVLSSAFRGVEEISAPARFISSGLKSLQGDQTSILKRSLIGSINPALGFAMGANLDSSNQVGRVSEKNLKSFGQALLDASDDMDSTDLSRFSKLLSQDVSVALSDLANELGLTVEDLKTIREKLNPSEIKSGLSYFRELKGENLQRAAEAEPLLREKNRRFQISGIEWERAGFLGGIGIQQNNIRQSSNIRNQNAISSALLDVNPNISEISRVSRGGDIQLSNLRQNNTLSFQTAAMQAATVGVSDLARQSGSIFKDEDLRKLSGMYQRAAQTGSADELSSYLKELSDKQEAVVNSTDDAKKEQASNFKQLILASKDTVKELIGLNESSSASERELKISNALNVIRAKDQQKQSFLDKSVYSIDTFTQARRLKEQASGISFTDGKYKTGLTQQGKLNEADFLSNLGIANTDESLSYYNKVKSSRARSTLSELISQETGQKVGTDRKSVEAAINSIQDPIKAGRYRETLSLSTFNATNAIKNIGAGTGSTSATIENLMKIGETDPIQTITAQNTGKIADIGVEMNGNIVEGFTNLWTLMDSAFNKNKESEIYTKAVGKRFGAEADVSRAKKERELRIQSALETPEVRKALGSYDFGNDTGAIKAFAKGGSYEDLRNALFSPDRLREHENKSGISGKMYEENTMNQLANIAKYEGSKDTIVNLSDADTQLAKFTDAAKIATEELTKLHNTNTSVTNPVLTAGIPSVTATKPTKLLPETDGDDNSGLEQRAKNIDKISNSFKGFKDGMKSATAEIMTFAQMGEEAGKTVANSLGNAFAGFVTGSIKGKDAWKSFVSSMLAGLAQMYAQEAMKSMMSSFMGANTGGSILKFASGGSVPALLTGGEYYFNASSAKAIGQNKLNSINSGTAHFAGGGLVSGGSGYMDDVPAMLDNGGFVIKRSAVQKYGASNLSALSRNSGGDVRMFASGGNVSPSFSTGSNISGGNTSVKIELNDHRTSASSSSDDSSSDPEFNRRLGMAIKSAVLQTVNEQKRIGGTLRE